MNFSILVQPEPKLAEELESKIEIKWASADKNLREHKLLETISPKTDQFSRKFPRRKFGQNVGLLSNGQFTIVPSLEVGEGGLLFKSDRQLKIGSRVVVNFFVPEKGFIAVTGEVLYKKEEANFGLRFVNLAFESKRFIRDFIAEKNFC